MALSPGLCDREMNKFVEDASGDTAVRVVQTSSSSETSPVPTVETAYVTGSVTATTSELEAKVGASPLTNRKVLYLQNTGTTDIYYGPTGLVADATSATLEPGEFVFMPVGAGISVFLIVASGTEVVTVQEFS